MTVLDFDPPQRTLRLVASSGAAAPARDHRYRQSAVVHGQARDLYREVLQASLASQIPINPDALRVILATKQTTTASPARSFSATGIWQLLFVDVVTWCRNRQLAVPEGCASALLRVIEHLDTTDTFDQDSDQAWRLYDAIDECTGGWVEDLHPAQPPSRKKAKPARRRSSLPSKRGSQRT